MPFPRYRKWTFGSLRVKIGVLKADVDIQRQAIDSVYAVNSLSLYIYIRYGHAMDRRMRRCEAGGSTAHTIVGVTHIFIVCLTKAV